MQRPALRDKHNIKSSIKTLEPFVGDSLAGPISVAPLVADSCNCIPAPSLTQIHGERTHPVAGSCRHFRFFW